MKDSGKPMPVQYRAALMNDDCVDYFRGHLPQVLKWAKDRTAPLRPGTYCLTITPVNYLLPWERKPHV